MADIALFLIALGLAAIALILVSGRYFRDDPNRHRTTCLRCEAPIPPGGYLAGAHGMGYCHTCAQHLLKEDHRPW